MAPIHTQKSPTFIIQQGKYLPKVLLVNEKAGETMASHFLSIPEQQREVSLRMYLFQIQGVPILLGHFLDFDRSILRLTARRKDNQEKRYTYLSE